MGDPHLSSFSKALESGDSLLTCEINPPKGTELNSMFEKIHMLESVTHAFNITDSAGSVMTMAPIAAAHLLRDRGFEPILQITCRDRNRLALQAEMLAAAALGIPNLLCMTGDSPAAGDHKDAKAVFDLDGIELVKAATTLRKGTDLAGNDLEGTPNLCIGAVVNPGAPDLNKELHRMEEKIEAGAVFFQTQAVYDPKGFEQFCRAVEGFGIPVMAGHIVLKSAAMAQNMTDKLPGVRVPDEIIRELGRATNVVCTSKALSARIIKDVKPMCNGIHIMAIGWESKVRDILETAGL